MICAICGTVTVAVARLRAALALKLCCPDAWNVHSSSYPSCVGEPVPLNHMHSRLFNRFLAMFCPPIPRELSLGLNSKVLLNRLTSSKGRPQLTDLWFVIGQFHDGWMVSAERALRIAFDRNFPEHVMRRASKSSIRSVKGRLDA